MRRERPRRKVVNVWDDGQTTLNEFAKKPDEPDWKSILRKKKPGN